MAQVPSPTSLVNGFVIPADPNWNPLPVALPDQFLQEAPPPIDAADFPDWRETLAALPEGRRNRVRKCRRSALHIRKHTDRGAVESVNPIACGDRVACPYCSVRYAHERAWSATQKLATVSLTASNFGVAAAAPVHILEFRAVIPEWLAAVRVPGCETSEIRARLCPTAAGCLACTAAAQAHAGAEQAETDLSRWAIDAWTALRPDTGGVRHTAIRQDSPGAPIQLVVTLHIPAVSAKVFPGAKIAGARAQRRSFVPVTETEIAELRQAWVAFVSRNYGAPAATLDHSAPLEWEDIWSSFRRTHAPAWGAWGAMLGRHPGAVVTPDAALTYARAAGFGTIGDSGKSRRVQRTSWFGIFGGRHQLEVMAALDIRPHVRDPHAQIEVLDTVRLLQRGPTHTRVQSVRDGQFKLLANELIRLMDVVDTTGRPSVAPDTTTWEYESITRAQTLNDVWHQQARLGRDDAGGVQIPNKLSLESAPWSRQTKSERKKAARAEALQLAR